MPMTDYAGLIRRIPADRQSMVVKKENWDRVTYGGKDIIEGRIFGGAGEVEISRGDVIAEEDARVKIVKTLMWGFPPGGRADNIANALSRLDDLEDMLSRVRGRNLDEDEEAALLSGLESIRGVGPSAWSKLLHFFEVSFRSRRCQIFDQKIVDSLNRGQFAEFGSDEWKHDSRHYFPYIDLLDRVARSIGAEPDQLELFMYYTNLHFRLG